MPAGLTLLRSLAFTAGDGDGVPTTAAGACNAQDLTVECPRAGLQVECGAVDSVDPGGVLGSFGASCGQGSGDRAAGDGLCDTCVGHGTYTPLATGLPDLV